MRKINSKVSIKLLIILIISMFIISISTTIHAKYIFQNEFFIANLNIDRTNPKIELVDITNSNTDYESYANNTHTITIKVKITDKNLKDVILDKDHIKIKINDEYVNDVNIKYNKIEDITDGEVYEIELKDLNGNGNLKVDVLEGTAVDTGELKNELLEINTNITIDNITPEGNFTENKISDGNVNATIDLSETIKELEGWQFLDDKLKDSSEFSVVYQILVNETGWVSACSDGQECMYDKDKPVSAFRIALVPKTEKQYVIDTWNKDVGTFNLK